MEVLQKSLMLKVENKPDHVIDDMSQPPHLHKSEAKVHHHKRSWHLGKGMGQTFENKTS